MADTFVEEAFSYSELKSHNERKDALKTLIKRQPVGARFRHRPGTPGSNNQQPRTA